MTSPQAIDPASIKPRRFWYVVAVGLFVGSLVPAFFLAKSGLETIDLSVDPVTGDTIEIHDEQLSVFGPAHFSMPGLLRCTLTPPGGGRPIPLDYASTDLTLDGHERVGVTPDGLPEGSYRLACAAGSDPIDSTSFGVRSTEGWTVAILELVAAVVIPGIAGLTAITIAVITAVRRSSARRRLLQPTTPMGPPGYPPPPPGYPPRPPT